MSDFTPPVRETVSIHDAFVSLLNQKLVKDLHDNEELCPVCGGVGMRIIDNRYGLSDDTTHPGVYFPYMHQSICMCNNCYNGVILRCQYCGKQIRRGWLTCDCAEVRRQKEQTKKEKLKAAFAAAEKHEPDALGSTFLFGYSDDYPYNNGYFEDWDDFFDAWFDDDVRPLDAVKPEYVWGTDPQKMSFDAHDLVENACEEMYEDAMCDIGNQPVAEMQQYLDQWAEKYGVTTWYEDHHHAIRIPWEEREHDDAS